MSNLNFSIKPILKSGDFSSFTAVIMEPEVDLHGDIASDEVIKKTAHNYIKNQKMQSKIQHNEQTKDFDLVESYVLEEEKDFDGVKVKKGSWVGKFHVNSEALKEQIKNGNYNGVSIGAKAIVEDIELQKSIENPYKDKPIRRIKEILNINEISLVDYPANNKKILSLNKGVGNMEEENTIEILKSSLRERDERLAVLEKAHEEMLRKEFSVKVAEIKKYAKADDRLTDALMKVSKAFPNEYKIIEKTVFDSIDTIKNMNLMESKGVDNPLDLSKSSGFDRIEVIAKGLMDQDNNLTKEQAIAKVYSEKLY